MAEQNLYVNCLISKPVYFADLCNAVIFDGKQIIRPEDLTTLPGHSGVMIADGVRQGNDEGEERLSSLISLLIKMQRIDLVEQVACNRELRRKLYKKYNL